MLAELTFIRMLSDTLELSTPVRWRNTARFEVRQRSVFPGTPVGTPVELKNPILCASGTPRVGSEKRCSLRAPNDCNDEVREMVGSRAAVEPKGRLLMEGSFCCEGSTLTMGDDHSGSGRRPSTLDTGRRTGSFQPEFTVVVNGMPLVAGSALSIWGG